MGSEKYNLLLETIKFLEFCQSCFTNGKIQLKDYRTMTEIKFMFLDKILQEDSIFIDGNENIETQLYKILTNHRCILNPS